MDGAPNTTGGRAAEPMPRSLALLLAVACGTAVASLYWAQPLLAEIARELGVREGTAGVLVTAAQVGYVVGILFLVPLGDLLERRRLVVGMLVVTAALSAACAAAPGFAALLALTVALGVAATVTQVLVPLASLLAAEHERGRVVGTVMSGLLLGILLARTVGGLLAGVGSWRLVYAVAAVALLLLAAVLRARLPRVPATEALPYPRLLASVGSLVREEPLLRRRMLVGATVMAGFSILWTSLTFLLASPAYGYPETVIGLFGLAGVAGALAAPLAGRLADGGRGHVALVAFLACVLAGWGALALGEASLAALIVGIVVLDLGVQGTQISNQSAIYALRPEARSRLTTAYIGAYFLGGAAGSGAAAVAWSAGAWPAVCALGGAIALGGLVAGVRTARVDRRVLAATAA